MSKRPARPVSLRLLGRAALRIGARSPDSDLGLALAAVGLILAAMPYAPRQVRLPPVGDVADLLPLGTGRAAGAVLGTAEGLVEWLAATADVELALTEPAGSC